MTEYFARDSYLGTISAKAATTLGPLITALEEELGRAVTPADLVVEAMPTTSPLHRYFEWDNTRAANAFRLGQARTILRAMEIELPQMGGKRVRAFLPTTREGGEGFLSTERAIRDRPDMIEMMFRRTYDEAVRIDETLGTWRDVLRSVEAQRFLDAAADLRRSYAEAAVERKEGVPV